MKRFILPLLLLLSLHHTTRTEPVTVATAALSAFFPSLSFSSVMNFAAVSLALNFFTQGADAQGAVGRTPFCEGLATNTKQCNGNVNDVEGRTCKGLAKLNDSGAIEECYGEFSGRRNTDTNDKYAVVACKGHATVTKHPNLKTDDDQDQMYCEGELSSLHITTPLQGEFTMALLDGKGGR